MGTAPRAWLRGLAALCVAAALAAPALGYNYTEYANATLQNDLAKLRIQRDLYKTVADPYWLDWNAYLMAKIQTNQTMTQNWTIRLYSLILEAITANATPQANLNLGLLYLGQNGSQLNCGNASGGNCGVPNVTQGRTRVEKEKLGIIQTDANYRLDMARLRAKLFNYWATWYVSTQKGIVAILSNNW